MYFVCHHWGLYQTTSSQQLSASAGAMSDSISHLTFLLHCVIKSLHTLHKGDLNLRFMSYSTARIILG